MTKFSPRESGKQLSHKMRLEHISFIVSLLVNIVRTQERLQKPTVVGDPSSAVGFQGGSYLIRCTTPISVDRKIYLFRGSEKIFEEISSSNKVVTFVLVNLTSSDQGTYRCGYETLHRPRRRSQPSYVLHLKVKDIRAPFSQLFPLAAAVPEGGNLTLTCKANNTLRCVFYTNRGDRYVPLPLPQGKTRTSLSLMGVTSDDAGRYVCNCFVERNELSVLSAVSNVMTLTVNGNVRKPNISFEHTTGLGLLGGSIVIKCEVPAEGEKIVSILKDSKKISNVNSLSESEEYFTFLHLTSRSAGHYQCIYETILPNKGKSPPSDTILLTILDVHASQSVLIFSALELTVGGSLRMSCHANSTAKCLFFEYGDEDSLGRPMLEATSNVAVELAKVSLCDSADYVCLCLMEINGVEAISAASEPVTFRVIEGSKGTGINSKPDDKRDGPLFIVLTLTMFMILVTLCVILGVYLSRKASKQHKNSTPLEMELQVTL